MSWRVVRMINGERDQSGVDPDNPIWHRGPFRSHRRAQREARDLQRYSDEWQAALHSELVVAYQVERAP